MCGSIRTFTLFIKCKPTFFCVKCEGNKVQETKDNGLGN